MGIDTGAVIIVGLPYDQFNMAQDELDELIDNGDIDSASPYFDADRDDCVYGIRVAKSDYRAEEFTLNDNLINSAKQSFKDTYGQEPKVYLSANI